MSDASEGAGWWVASDGKWYAPEKHGDPEYRARFETPPAIPPPAPIDPPPVAAPPPVAPPTTAAVAPVAPAVPATKPTQGRGLFANPATWIIVIGGVVGLVAVLILFVFSGDDDAQTDRTRTGDAADLEQATDDSSSSSSSESSSSDNDTSDDADTDDPAASDDSGPEVTMPEGVGTEAQPVAFGEVYQWERWGGTILEIIDVDDAGLVGEFNDPPSEGNMYIGVIYEATYIGTELTGIEPFLLDSPNTTIIDGFACFLEPEPLLAIGIELNLFELVRGQSALLIECLEVPTGATDNMTISMNNVAEFGEPITFAPSGAELPALPAVPGPNRYDISPLGTVLDTGDWSASVTEIFNGLDAGLIWEFAPAPRDGYTYIVVRYDVAYSGDSEEEFLPHVVSGLGSAVFSQFNACFLDDEAAGAIGIDVTPFGLSANEAVTIAVCLEVPVDEVSTLVVRLAESFSFDDQDVVLYSAS